MPTFRALLIGINYTNSKNRLFGCINDVRNVNKLLLNFVGYQTQEITIMTDDLPPTSPLYPNKANILAAMTKVASEIKKEGDVLFVHYSGHGTYVRQTLDKQTKVGDEDDGRDEAICPIDYQTAGLILDDQLRATLIEKLPAGAIFRAIFDNCFSGTVLDCRYVYRPSSTLANTASLTKVKNSRIPLTACDAKYISGARDDQAAADSFANGEACGALTDAILKSISTLGLGESCGAFLNNVTAYMLKQRQLQRPMLGSGAKENIDETPFFFKLR